MRRIHWICLALVPCMVLPVLATSLSVSEIQATGKVLFRALRDSECKVKCKSRKPRIMCGSDGNSYLSKCEVKRARRCEGKNVVITRKGKCSAKDIPMTKCFQEREAALATGKPGARDVFTPECSSDGNYAPIQCHQATGYCWCVSKDGKPFSNTSIKNRKPNCNPKENDDKWKGRATKKPYNKKIRRKKKREYVLGCTSGERDKFNSNLVKVFTEEYNRSMRTYPDKTTNLNDKRRDKLEKLVVDWKFEQYDANSDKKLQRKEVNSLRRLVKKFIKPRACAKTFLKYCDFDRNRLISPREWSQCLGVDSGSDQNTTPDPPEPKKEKGEIGRPDFPALPIDKDQPWSRPPVNRPMPKKKNDCVGEQIAALEQEQDNPEGRIFIPNCTREGKWHRAQCHASTGYCWCVEENTGHPIRGTSTHGVQPKCDFDEGERPIPDCSYAEKQSFLANLLYTLTIEMAEYTQGNKTGVSSLLNDPDQGAHEKAVRWKFSVIDLDFSQTLQNGELDAVKESIKRAQTKATRKCARRFIKYCDADGDKRITQIEWVDCMGVTRNVGLTLPSNPKRTGKNPFDQFLRDS